MNVHDYCCTICKSKLNINDKSGLICSNGHTFSFIAETNIPVFDCEDANTNEYTTSKAAEIHDNALKWLFSTFGTTESSLRDNMIARLHLKKGQKILVTGVGAGNDLPYLAELIGEEGIIYAQDYSTQMLEAASMRANSSLSLNKYKIEFSVSDATNLPFQDNFFDAVYHFGGLNMFSNIEKGILEMDRVVKDEGRVVFGDEGLAPWHKNTQYGKMIINNNALCSFDAPLIYLPTSAKEVNLSWDVGYSFYIIDYTSSNTPYTIDIDVPHVGKRGGSIRTRYFGKLEGIDPSLKDSVNAKAEKIGMSRVDLIEKLLRMGLDEC